MLIVEYRVGLAERARHLFEIEARFPIAAADTVDLRLPVWTPGSYLIREFQRHLQELSVTDGEGRPLGVRKIDKATWRVECGGATELRARYQVYAHEVTVRTSHLDLSHAYWNGACLFLYVDALRPLPVRVLVDAPPGWRIATGLDADPTATRGIAFRADDHDALVDAPFEIGPHERIEFQAAERPHAVAIWGRTTAADRARLGADLAKIVETHAALFGGLPYAHYTFILHLVPKAHGGLEHRNSTTVIGDPHAFGVANKYQDLLEVCSHEFLHLWNVKRIYPEALQPSVATHPVLRRGPSAPTGIDYQREAYTRSLWVVEGWTSYYDRLALRRAGLQGAARYREKLGEELTRLAAIPGRRRQSLEEASFDAWIKLYRPDENTVNSTVSYYLKGSIVALLLDLEIRRRSDGHRTLDDALRLLWREYGQVGRGYPDEAIQPLCEQAAGLSLDDFFARAVRGREELDLAGPLGSVGLCVRPAGGGSDEGPAAWLGATLVQEGDRLRVAESQDGGPAQAGGLYPGDQLLACDGYRVDKEALAERIGARRPGVPIRLTVFRRDELQEMTVTLGLRPLDHKLEVGFADQASPEAKAAYQAWMGEAWGGE